MLRERRQIFWRRISLQKTRRIGAEPKDRAI